MYLSFFERSTFEHSSMLILFYHYSIRNRKMLRLSYKKLSTINLKVTFASFR